MHVASFLTVSALSRGIGCRPPVPLRRDAALSFGAGPTSSADGRDTSSQQGPRIGAYHLEEWSPRTPSLYRTHTYTHPTHTELYTFIIHIILAVFCHFYVSSNDISVLLPLN